MFAFCGKCSGCKFPEVANGCLPFVANTLGANGRLGTPPTRAARLTSVNGVQGSGFRSHLDVTNVFGFYTQLHV